MRLVFLCAIFCLLGACASLDRGLTDQLRVDSVPQGASVTVIREITPEYNRKAKRYETLKTYVCDATPCAIEVPRRSRLIATIDAEGYEPASFYVESSTIKGGAVGSVVTNTGISTGSSVLTASFAASWINAFSFGLNPASQSAYVASGATIGLGIGLGFVAIDASSGAYLNLYPNPIIVGLAEQGSQTQKSLMAETFQKKINTKKAYFETCKGFKNKTEKRAELCDTLELKMEEAETTFTKERRAMHADRKKAIEAAKEQAAKEKASGETEG